MSFEAHNQTVEHHRARNQKGFTLLEMMAVVVIIGVMLGVTAITFANAQPSVKVKKDAGQMVAFLRNMWDQTKTTGAPLVLIPDFEKGGLSYNDPRTATSAKARFSSKAKILGIKINDRMYSAQSREINLQEDELLEEDDPMADAIYISEGRGLTRVSVIFGIPQKKDGDELEDSYKHLTMASLNLITGRGKVQLLNEEELASLLDPENEEVVE